MRSHDVFPIYRNEIGGRRKLFMKDGRHAGEIRDSRAVMAELLSQDCQDNAALIENVE